MGKALTLALFLFFLLFSLPFAYASENQFLVNDPDLYSPLTWSYGTYQANSSESYVMHDSDNHLFKFHVADNLSDDSFGWGFLHQGVQLHGQARQGQEAHQRLLGPGHQLQGRHEHQGSRLPGRRSQGNRLTQDLLQGVLGPLQAAHGRRGQEHQAHHRENGSASRLVRSS